MTRTWEIERRISFKVDVTELRDSFGYDLGRDGVDLEDDEAVVRTCWENGVCDPYFIRTADDYEEAWLL